MSIFKSAGAAVGLMVGVFIALVIFKFANMNHHVRTEYDERQKEVRGRAYMYGFYTIVIYECLMLILSIGKIALPVEDYIMHFGGILLGCTALGVYSIWKDAYWGLNNNSRRYSLVFAALLVLNAFPVIASIRSGGMLRDGRLTGPVLNLMVLLMMLVLAIVLLVKGMAKGSSEETEE